MVNHNLLNKSVLTPAFEEFCRTLKSMTLTHCDLITDDHLRLLARSNNRLTKLTLHKLPMVTDSGVASIIEKQVEINSVEISHLLTLGAKTMTALAACTTLRYVNLRNCPNITDDSLFDLVRAKPQITSLNLSQCKNLRSCSLAALMNALQDHLEELDLAEVSTVDDSVLLQLTRCRKLKCLIMQGYNRITGAALATCIPLLSRLRNLDLAYCQPPDGAPNWPDKLESLSLIGMQVFDAQRLKWLVSGLVRTRLRSLKLCGIPALNDESLT